MAHIRANTKNGKIVSYRFTVCLGRDCNGKQIRKYTTWPIPPDTSTAKAKKAAERAADIWEQELMNEYHKKLEAESAGKAYQIPAEKRHDDFVSFVNDVWFPLQVRDGKRMGTSPCETIHGFRSWAAAMKSISELERWQDLLKLSALPFCTRCAITTPTFILSKTPAVAIPTTTNALRRLPRVMA